MNIGITTIGRIGLALSALLFPASVLAGPPLLCHPLDTAGAPTLAWGGDGWNQARADYDLAGLGDRTEALLTPATPIIARMETLRRAAIYASRDGVVLRDLAARLETRLKTANDVEARALALFDTGYLLETLQEIDRLQDYDMPGIGEVAELPGFILASGFSGHGFGIGPGAGHLIADLVTGAEPIFDPKPYDPARFRHSAWGKVADF